MQNVYVARAKTTVIQNHPNIDVSFSLLVLCCRSLLTHWHNSCWADWPAQAGSNRKAGRGKSMKLKLLLLYSIHATYGRIQMTEMQKSLSETSMILLPGGLILQLSCHPVGRKNLTICCQQKLFHDRTPHPVPGSDCL